MSLPSSDEFKQATIRRLKDRGGVHPILLEMAVTEVLAALDFDKIINGYQDAITDARQACGESDRLMAILLEVHWRCRMLANGDAHTPFTRAIWDLVRAAIPAGLQHGQPEQPLEAF